MRARGRPRGQHHLPLPRVRPRQRCHGVVVFQRHRLHHAPDAGGFRRHAGLELLAQRRAVPSLRRQPRSVRRERDEHVPEDSVPGPRGDPPGLHGGSGDGLQRRAPAPRALPLRAARRRRQGLHPTGDAHGVHQRPRASRRSSALKYRRDRQPRLAAGQAPAWYKTMSNQARWEVQMLFWRELTHVGASFAGDHVVRAHLRAGRSRPTRTAPGTAGSSVATTSSR